MSGGSALGFLAVLGFTALLALPSSAPAETIGRDLTSATADVTFQCATEECTQSGTEYFDPAFIWSTPFEGYITSWSVKL